MSQDKIIARMKKLLAMSEGTANEHEAMIATRRLHIMLAKHNISITDLSDDGKEEIGEEGFTTRSRPWKRLIANKIAELYFCSCYTSGYKGDSSKDIMFVGSEANRMFAIHITKLIIKVIERQGHKECKDATGRSTGPFYNSFLTGAQRRISERCNELIESAKAGTLEDEEGNMLPALLSTYDVISLDLDHWISKNLNLSKGTARTKSTCTEGHNAGIAAGNKVQLSRALQSQNAPKMIGVQPFYE